MSNPLRVGVVGCGAISQIMHIPYLTEHERFELVSLCDAYEPVLKDVGDRFGIERRYTNWNDLLANDDLDAVVIAHAGSHKESVIAALDANKHVFVEKPLGWNLAEVEAVAAHARQSDCIVQLGYHKLYDPAFAYTRDPVQQMKDLGFVRITVLHPANELGFSPHRLRRGNGRIESGHHDPGTWESQLQGQLGAFAGGVMSPLVDAALGDKKQNPHLRLAYGIMTVSLIHQIYMLYGFLGEPEKVISTDIWRDGFSIHALVQYPNDVRCTLDWHFLSHLKNYHEEYAFYGNHDRVILRFPSPYFRNFPSPVTIEGGEGELAWEKTVTVSHGEAFENELLAFHDNIQQKTTPISSVEDAVKHERFVQQLIDAAR